MGGRIRRIVAPMTWCRPSSPRALPHDFRAGDLLMGSNRFLVALLLLIIALGGGAIVHHRLRTTGEREAMPGPRPSATDLAATSHGRYRAILEEYQAADRRVAEAIRAASAERKDAELLRRQELKHAFADRFLALARDSAGDPAAGDDVIDALTWVISDCPEDPWSRRAVEQLLEGPILSERMADACRKLDARESPIAEPVLREVLGRNPHELARAQASLALARALRRRSERAGPGKGDLKQAADLVREAESLYEGAMAQYGQLRIGGGTVAEIAGADLFELRSLAIGREAPEIEGLDLEGRPMALSGFRGKVVVLEFWGHW
jgi:hypothetical protein